MSGSETGVTTEQPASEEATTVTEVDAKIAATAGEVTRGDVSAATIGRMLGLAGSGELKLLEGKIDLVSTRVSNLTVRMEKITAGLQKLPSAVDLERIDVQIGNLRTMLRNFIENAEAMAEKERTRAAAAPAAPAADSAKPAK